MKIIANDIFGKIIFSFENNPQWVANYQEKFRIIDFIERDSDQLIFSSGELYKESSLLHLSNIIKDYKEDNPSSQIIAEGTFADSILQLLESKLEENKKIMKSYQNVINDKWERKNLNKEFYLDSFQPHAFQIEHAQDVISKKDSANFSSPGAGKTIIAYMAIGSLFADSRINDVVVFGPKSASLAWKNEWEIVLRDKYINKTNLENLDFSNRGRNNLRHVNPKSWDNSKLNVWFFNFHKMTDHSFTEELIQKLKSRKFILIIDEAHYIKNKFGKWHESIALLSKFANYSLILTGTPLPRFASEGNYLLNIIWPNINHDYLTENDFKSFSEKENPELKTYFKKIFSRKNKKELEESGELKKVYKYVKEVPMTKIEKMLINQINLSFSSENILDVKTCQKMNKALLIRRMQASSYPLLLKEPLDDVLKDLREDLMDIREEKDSKTYFNEENSMINDASQDDSLKIENFIQKTLNSSQFNEELEKYKNQTKIPERWDIALNLIEEHNENIIIWDIFRKSMNDFKKFLAKNLKGNRRVILINGEVNGKKRLEKINQFKKSQNAILIASPATIAESVSLHRSCHIAIYLYKNYIGSHWMQSIDRIHRLVSPGDDSKEKFIYNIIASGDSIDQMIMNNLNEKEKQQSSLID